MTGKPEDAPFVSPLTPEFYAAWRASLKQLLVSSLETNEKIAKAALVRYEKTMIWTKDTPWAPWCKGFVSATGKLVEGTSRLLRVLWHVEHSRGGPEKMSKA
jgi:hypothetical protein